MVKAIVFDFDGVIIESFDIKTQAFRELFKGSDKVNEIVEYHKQNGGVSRYKKFKHIYSEILKQPLDDKIFKELGEKFSNLVVEEVKKCPYVPGAFEFINKQYGRKKLFIASGTPEEELHDIVAARGIFKYFKGVYGSPATKSEIMRGILEREKLGRNEVLFIGDAITDYHEANRVGVLFMARINKLPDNPLLSLKVPKFYDFYDLSI
jgi:HAD superfamily hydrolase (TIGR01549 family)